MSLTDGVVLLLIGLISSITLLISGYKEFKKDETKTSKKVLFLILDFLEIFNPNSLNGFAFMLSLVAIVIGLILINGLFH